MDIEIRKLTPDLAEDYAHFFDVTPHDINEDEAKCYCVTWRSDASYANEGHWFPTREDRRAHAIHFIKTGSLQGYLAYCGDEIVGWCNANGDCQYCLDYLRTSWPIEEYREDVRVKSIFCFVITPRLQRQGIATQLVERVCMDAEREGYDFAEAYVNSNFIDTCQDFRGPVTMYEKCGFVRFAERDGKTVMRKALRQRA